MEEWHTLNERRNTELRELLRLATVRQVIKRDRFRSFVHAECKDNVEWVKKCMSIETEGTSPGG